MSPLFPSFMTRACCALIISALLPFPADAAPIKLKFSFFSSDREYAYESVVKPFVNAVNLEGKGIVEIELYPSGALGRSYAQQMQLVLSGDADIAWINPALTPEQFPDNSVIELPGLFRDANEAARAIERTGRELQGEQPLGPTGPRHCKRGGLRRREARGERRAGERK